MYGTYIILLMLGHVKEITIIKSEKEEEEENKENNH